MRAIDDVADNISGACVRKVHQIIGLAIRVIDHVVVDVAGGRAIFKQLPTLGVMRPGILKGDGGVINGIATQIDVVGIRIPSLAPLKPNSSY